MFISFIAYLRLVFILYCFSKSFLTKDPYAADKLGCAVLKSDSGLYIDALGGLMGIVADQSHLQIKVFEVEFQSCNGLNFHLQ